MLWIRLAQDAYVDLTFGNDVTWDGSVGHDCFSVDAFIKKTNKKTKHTPRKSNSSPLRKGLAPQNRRACLPLPSFFRGKLAGFVSGSVSPFSMILQHFFWLRGRRSDR